MPLRYWSGQTSGQTSFVMQCFAFWICLIASLCVCDVIYIVSLNLVHTRSYDYGLTWVQAKHTGQEHFRGGILCILLHRVSRHITAGFPTASRPLVIPGLRRWQPDPCCAKPGLPFHDQQATTLWHCTDIQRPVSLSPTEFASINWLLY